MPRIRELERVRDQVLEDLGHLRSVGPDRDLSVGRHDVEDDAVGRRARVAHRAPRERDGLLARLGHRRTPQLQVRQLEDVRDQLQERGARPLDLPERIRLLAGHRTRVARGDQVRIAEYRRQWRPQLVAHVRHELVLEPP